MPLVRYEIRSEYELANRELYRSAPKNDPEAILEGVAMVSLVGIVRQLGDLAEFAADIFHELHEALMATASRSHELGARVSQLESELPGLERSMLSTRSNPLQLAYSPGVDWHASIQSDQNHCTQGDLPRFIRSSYEECRGPPRLFLLDKFDVGGVGACLKRYTDPSFFKMEWASSELMKAEKAQHDKRSRRSKTRRKKEEALKDPRPPVQLQPRNLKYSTISTSSLDALSDSTTPLNTMAVESDQSGLSRGFPFVTFLGSSSRETGTKPVKNLEEVAAAVEVVASSREPEEKVLIEENAGVEASEGVEDPSSEPEKYLDAMTTMDSESDLESRRLSNFRTEAVEAEPGEERNVEEVFLRNSETESKFSSELKPIPAHHPVEEIQLEQQEETGDESENDALEMDHTREASTGLVPDEEEVEREVPLEKEVHVSEPGLEIDGLPERQIDMIDLVEPEVIHGGNEEEVIPESTSEAGSEEQPLVRRKPRFRAEDDEAFDVEVIQVPGDDGELAKEVEFEPLAASDEDSTPELEVEPEVREFRPDSEHHLDVEPHGGEPLDDLILENGVEHQQDVEDEVHDENQINEELSLEEPHDKQNDSLEELELEKEMIPLKDEGSGTPLASEVLETLVVEEMKTPEESLSPGPEMKDSFAGGSAEVSMNGDEDFESASSHEDFFLARSSSRFSDFSDEHSLGVEVDEDKEGYFGDDDSTKNHSEASEQGRSPLGAAVPDDERREEASKIEQVSVAEPPKFVSDDALQDHSSADDRAPESLSRELEPHSAGVPVREEQFGLQPRALVEEADDEAGVEFEETKLAGDHQLIDDLGELEEEKLDGGDHQLAEDIGEFEEKKLDGGDHQLAEDIGDFEEKKLDGGDHQLAEGIGEFEEKKLDGGDHQLAEDIGEFEEKKLNGGDHQLAEGIGEFGEKKLDGGDHHLAEDIEELEEKKLDGGDHQLAEDIGEFEEKKLDGGDHHGDQKLVEDHQQTGIFWTRRETDSESNVDYQRAAEAPDAPEVSGKDHIPVELAGEHGEETGEQKLVDHHHPPEIFWTRKDRDLDLESSSDDDQRAAEAPEAPEVSGKDHIPVELAGEHGEVTGEEKLVDHHHPPEIFWTRKETDLDLESSSDDDQRAAEAPEAPEIHVPVSTGAPAPTLTLDELEEDSISEISSLSSSPRSPIFTALSPPGSPGERLGGFLSSVAPGSPSLSSAPPPFSYGLEPGIPPLPPLPPLRWRTPASPRRAVPAAFPRDLSEASSSESEQLAQSSQLEQFEHMPVDRGAFAEPESPLHTPENLMVTGHTQPVEPEVAEPRTRVQEQEKSDKPELPEVRDPGVLQQADSEMNRDEKLEVQREAQQEQGFHRHDALDWRDNLVFEEEASTSLSQLEVSELDDDLVEAPEVIGLQKASSSSGFHLDRLALQFCDRGPEPETTEDLVEPDRSPRPQKNVPELQQKVEGPAPVSTTPVDQKSESPTEEVQRLPGFGSHEEQKNVDETSASKIHSDKVNGDEQPRSSPELPEQQNDEEKTCQKLPISTLPPADDSYLVPPAAAEQNDEQIVLEPRTPSWITPPKDPADEALIQAISSHDKNKLKKVPSDSPTPKSGERDVLLEQIRSQSFNLRHTIVEKKEAKESVPRLITNINVAAILEKANAIRQAFAGSDDEEDDWSE